MMPVSAQTYMVYSPARKRSAGRRPDAPGFGSRQLMVLRYRQAKAARPPKLTMGEVPAAAGIAPIIQ